MAGTGERLVDIAEADGTTPRAIAAIVMSVAREVSPQEYGYALPELQRILGDAGYALDPEATLRDEASRLGLDPEGLIDVLNGKGSEA